MQRTQKNIKTKKMGGSRKLFKHVKHFHCISCDKDFPLNTRIKLYLINKHGWVFCAKCEKKMKAISEREARR
ncbi:MAG: hypothetical protein GH144_00105 [Clostridia bacterium]|jgi:uncharacterized Zn finger protein (UPF0148 family)|nr:hypothetical protein [Clostridia bacterium]